jgi:DNA-binding MarR family transcriptional regulator
LVRLFSSEGEAMDEDGVIRLRRVISKLARQLNASSTDAGLTPSQASVLGLIVVRGPLSLGELADLEGLNPTMLSRVVSKLQAMGLIDRIPDPADLRSASVAATPEGRQIDQRVKSQRAAAVSQCMDLLTAHHQAVLTQALPALEELAEALRRFSHSGPPLASGEPAGIQGRGPG